MKELRTDRGRVPRFSENIVKGSEYLKKGEGYILSELIETLTERGIIRCYL
jgi:hypothetical protein